MAVSLQTSTPESLFHQTKALIALHQTHNAFHDDNLTVLDSPENLLVFERGEGRDKVLCVFNLSADEIEFQTPDAWTDAPTMMKSGQIQAVKETGSHRFSGWSWRFTSSHSALG